MFDIGMPPDSFPGWPYGEHGIPISGGASGAFTGVITPTESASHPDYALVYVGDTLFYLSDNPPLKWSLKRKDGVVPDVPLGATVRVWNSLGVLVATLTPDLDPDPPAGSRVLAALWSILAAGTYLTQITIILPTDGQIRSARQILQVR